MRRFAPAVAVLLAALPLASCGGGGDGDRYVLEVKGTAAVRDGSRTETLGTGRHHLRVGQTVTVTRGSAVLGLPGDTSLELRSGQRDSTVQVGPRPTLVDGDALAIAGSDDELTVRAGDATVGLRDGAARLRRSAGVSIAVYEGAASVESLGRRLGAPLRALRQVTVTDNGALPRRPGPLVYDREDPDQWDTRYLNDAIDLGGQLERRVRVLNARPAPKVLDADYLEEVVPALRSSKGFDAELVDAGRSVGETIVGASIALGGTGDLSRRWQQTFDFRAEGADWGLVAVDQRARRASVLGVLNGVIDRVVATVSPAAATSGLGSGAIVTGGAVTTTPTTAPPGGGSGTTVPGTPSVPPIPPITIPLLPAPPPTTPPQPSSPTPTTIPDPAPVLNPVLGLLDDLLSRGNGPDGNGPPGLVRGILGAFGHGVRSR